jgi:hypothetical protein
MIGRRTSTLQREGGDSTCESRVTHQCKVQWRQCQVTAKAARSERQPHDSAGACQQRNVRTIAVAMAEAKAPRRRDSNVMAPRPLAPTRP